MRNVLLIFCALTLAQVAWADGKTINFNYRDADVSKVIEDYAKASDQKFIIDPSTHGKITIINKGAIPLEEAFNQLSTALSVNGLGISKQGDQMVVQQARAIQRSMIEVSPEKPSLNPTRMYTWVINLKYASAEDVNKQLRILTSKDGELVPYTARNQILVTDWTPNLQRIALIVDAIDTQAKAKSTK